MSDACSILTLEYRLCRIGLCSTWLDVGNHLSYKAGSYTAAARVGSRHWLGCIDSNMDDLETWLKLNVLAAQSHKVTSHVTISD